MSDYIVVGCCPRHLINNNSSSNSRQQQCWWMGGVVRWCRRVRGHQTTAALYPPCKHWNLESGIPVLLGYCIFCISSTINDTFCVFLLHFVCFALLVQWWKDDNFCSLALDGTIFPIRWDDRGLAARVSGSESITPLNNNAGRHS